jgi:hypothetical protein
MDEFVFGPPGRSALETVIARTFNELPPNPCFGRDVSATIDALPPNPCFGALVSQEVIQLLGHGGISEGFLI